MPGLLLLFAGLLLAAPPESSDYSLALKRARSAIAAGQPGDALPALDEALRERPEGVEALTLLGRATVALGRFEEGEAAFARAVELEGLGTAAGLEALGGLADAQARAERNIEALATLERLLAAAPDRPGVHHDIGMIHFALGRLEAAAAAFTKEIKRKGPPSIQSAAWEKLGVTSYRLGQDDDALAALEKGTSSAEALWYRGLALGRLGRHEEALKYLRMVVEREPGHRGALQGIARSAGALGRVDEQRAALAEVAVSYQKEEAARRLKNRLYDLRAEADRKATAGDAAGAVAAMETAVAEAPDDLTLLLDLGRIRERVKDGAGAEEVYRRLGARDPMNAEAAHRLGRLLADRGDVAAAIPMLERAASLSPMTPTYRVHLARAYLRAGRAGEAVRELRLARRLTPDDPESAFNLGLGLASGGQMREAAAELEEARRLGFAEPQLFAAMARVYGALGETEKARAAQAELERLGRRP